MSVDDISLVLVCVLCAISTVFCDSRNKEVDGNWSEWSQWGQCSSSCGRGFRVRVRACDNPAPFGGAWCPGRVMQRAPCETLKPCPVNGSWSQWSDWSPCSVTCGQGITSRQRKCDSPEPMFGGTSCSGSPNETEVCHIAIKCQDQSDWSSWSKWSSCSMTCGEGVQIKQRVCNNSTNGSLPCVGRRKATKPCRVSDHCPVHGRWSLWSDWGECSATCGEGSRKRTRVCNRPEPKFGGHPCKGIDLQAKKCSLPDVPCPVDGEWSSWSSWGPCGTEDCTNNTITAHAFRQRSCNHPLPTHGGKMCVGNFLEAGVCALPVNCPVDGGWSEWSEWDCKDDSAKRVRSCDNPPPSRTGKKCAGETAEEIIVDEDSTFFFEICEDKNENLGNVAFGSGEIIEDYYE